MKQALIFFTLLALGNSAFAANTNVPCREEALVEAHRVTGDAEPFVVLQLTSFNAAKGTITQYAYFTEANNRNCQAQIKQGNLSCNSALVDVLEDIYDYPTTCHIVDSTMGDGNG